MNVACTVVRKKESDSDIHRALFLEGIKEHEHYLSSTLSLVSDVTMGILFCITCVFCLSRQTDKSSRTPDTLLWEENDPKLVNPS